MQKIALSTPWFAKAVSNFDEVPAELQGLSIPAQVPGCIHLDLLREELIPDPYLDQNETLVQWIGHTDWEFSTSFSVSETALQEKRLDLVCEGLDTVATIWVNGEEVGRSENMHVGTRWSIKPLLKATDNELRIRFDSAVHYARAMRGKLGDLPHANSYPDCEPFHFIRKNACNFGWDWGPALITAGIWKEIRLEAWSGARIESVRPMVRIANQKVAVLEVVVDIESQDSQLGAELFSAELLDPAGNVVAFALSEPTVAAGGATLTVHDPQLWWPRGYGEQPLYTLRVTLEEELAEYECEVGLREVELDTAPDAYGAAWTLKVNGQEIWCKGANWIPDDVFLPRANEKQRLETRLQQAADVGMNMMRIWGGGIYETDAFYSICDRMGMLVWQDFLFACAAYSEETPMRELVEAEARYNVARLARHPSLVLWNGCNENIWGYFDWKWQEKIQERTWGLGYYLEVLPSIIEELTPTIPYWAGSPYSGSMDIHPNSDQWGNKHMWDTWNQVNHTMFRSYSPRFASEFGHQAPPTYTTLQRSIPADQLDPFSPAMLHHQKAISGNDKLHGRLLEHFAMPEAFDDWLYLTQLMQARAMTTAVEWFRTRSVCRGALFWQLNDCWPVTSWAAIDGDGKPKPLYYAARQFFKARLLCIQPDGEKFALWAHNDSDEPWGIGGELRNLSLKEGESSSESIPAETVTALVPPRSLVKIKVIAPHHADKTRYLCFVERETKDKCLWFFNSDKNLGYPEPKWSATTEGNRLKIEAHTLLRDLCVFADRFGGSINEGMVTLLPGETWEVEIGGADLSGVDFLARPIVNCANYFGADA